MSLVAYSDSEGSDDEIPHSPETAKPVVTKREDQTLKVQLPFLKPEPEDEVRPFKKMKTASGFGDFNSLLSAPKRPAMLPKDGLKTSAEATFTRTPNLNERNNAADPVSASQPQYDGSPSQPSVEEQTKNIANDVKITGKATQFMPLSVANNKKKAAQSKAKKTAAIEPKVIDFGRTKGSQSMEKPLERRPLFSMLTIDYAAAVTEDDTAEVMLGQEQKLRSPSMTQRSAVAHSSANSLETVAEELNLTPSQRRQLFGRQGCDAASANITQFNMDQEYAANEQARQAGETGQHKTVRAIAPGKHSLQQLIRNAKSNEEGIQEKWAEGRHSKGGSKYGWGR
ncbi:hypothetical protein K470DRAFT_212857 [Piedraia hortae CBS 480.64]|uniref:Uncharacterized protein n=1 Tax=Piedraia hortae CBS 480.64 TaxID=1314780 RepID=A0A6A7C4S4_9PEZI|nr:hypothetical protein K470DRAFT_212857 [Piedraia hortae CBS 480.64]